MPLLSNTGANCKAITQDWLDQYNRDKESYKRFGLIQPDMTITDDGLVEVSTGRDMILNSLPPFGFASVECESIFITNVKEVIDYNNIPRIRFLGTVTFDGCLLNKKQKKLFQSLNKKIYKFDSCTFK